MKNATEFELVKVQGSVSTWELRAVEEPSTDPALAKALRSIGDALAKIERSK